MNFCQSCGSKLDGSNQFCPNCGAPVSTNQNTNNNNNNNATTINNNVNQNVSNGGKSRIAAGLLAIFLGCFGVHNFYLGYTGKAVAQLLLTVLSCFILSFVSCIWALIEGVLILTGSIDVDAQGNKLVD